MGGTRLGILGNEIIELTQKTGQGATAEGRGLN